MSEKNKSVLDAVNAQYEKSQAQAQWIKDSEDRLKQYFNTMLPKGEKSGEKRVRILPTKDGSSPFIEVWFHEHQVGNKWMKLWDPKQEGLRSPLNEVQESLKKTGLEEDKILARKYNAKKFYIIKVIDRDNPDDGVKFWRFPHNYKADGIFDKIYGIIRTKGDITDPDEGRDLTVFLQSVKGNNGKFYTTVNQILHEDPSPLSTKKEDSEEWLKDNRTWDNVYAKRPVEYLDLVAEGMTPKWDKDTETWIDGSVAEETQTEVKVVEKEVEKTPIVDPQKDEKPLEGEDLPF